MDFGADLAPGAVETYEFEIEVEVIVGREGFTVFMDPAPSVLTSAGVEVERSWTIDGHTENGWPEDRAVVRSGDPLVGVLTLTLTNTTDQRVARPLSITIAASALNVSGGSEENLKLRISQR